MPCLKRLIHTLHECDFTNAASLSRTFVIFDEERASPVGTAPEKDFILELMMGMIRFDWPAHCVKHQRLHCLAAASSEKLLEPASSWFNRSLISPCAIG